jgi:hypothetical protein
VVEFYGWYAYGLEEVFGECNIRGRRQWLLGSKDLSNKSNTEWLVSFF